MHEETVADTLKGAGVDVIISLPCDKNKRFTDHIHTCFDVIDVTREEDGVGICAGAYLAGKRPVMSIQSSGLGNMLNAMMSLTGCYKMPLVVLGSWRGVDGEKIEAQIPFNSRIPELLKCYDIGCYDVATADDIPKIGEAVKDAYDNLRMNVVLIHPKLWEGAVRLGCEYPSRKHTASVDVSFDVPDPSMTRLEAIGEVMSSVKEEDVVVSNIGVPSKETFASGDRPLNFYMLGSYTQATPIGLGIAMSCKRRVIVIDGDGSMLGSSIFPVLAQYHPDNLTIVCMDNGTFGSTGNQVNPAYSDVDMACVASGYGLPVSSVNDRAGIKEALGQDGFRFIRTLIRPGNSDSPNLTLRATEIRDRFMSAMRR